MFFLSWASRPLRPASALFLLLPLLLVASAGCSAPPPGRADSAGPVWFEDVSDTVGLTFVHDAGPTGTYPMPQSMGSGCAFLDCDGDGLLDLYLLHHGGPAGRKNQLFKQQPGGTFQDVSAGSGLDFAGFNHGVAVADVNNDGKPDVLVTQYGGLKLLLNQGGGRFADVTAASGLVNPLWGMSAAFLDHDRDGWLDLVVVNYLDFDPKKECVTPKGVRDFCGPNSFLGTCSKLFRNRGPDGPAAVRFEDVSFAAGVGRLPGPGLGVGCADLSGDGWVDIFVANDGQPNRLWVNQKDGTFADEAVSRGIAYTMTGKAFAGMGVGLGDVEGDGRLDLFVSHLGTETNTLWRQEAPGQFRDRTPESNVAATRWRGTGFGTVLADFDNDGSPDIAVVNGRVRLGGPARDTGLGFWETYAEYNQLLANDGHGRFRDLSPANPAFCGYWNVGRGLACADYDNDGGLDLLVTAIGGRARLFRNVAPERGHWLRVRAVDPKLQRDAVGAEVRVRGGDRQWLRLTQPAESYLSSSAPTAHFGLGAVAQVDAIEVTWPDGKRELFPGGPANRAVELVQGQGRAP